jgi:hypothetical protein
MNTTMNNEVVVGSGETQPAPRPTPNSGSTNPHEFLQMRARQRAARTRRRRLKRGGLLLGLGALVIGGWSLVRGHRLGHEALALAVPPPPAAPTLAAAPVEVVPATVATPTEVVAPAPAPPCEQDFSQREWRAAIDSCTRTFETAPSAAVALKVAHAHWSHGESAQAGRWAARAVELGTTDADAYVLIGHSERQAGHRQAAVAAYRHYLRSAPHGWHASRVRAALRQLRPRLASETIKTAH